MKTMKDNKTRPVWLAAVFLAFFAAGLFAGRYLPPENAAGMPGREASQEEEEAAAPREQTAADALRQPGTPVLICFSGGAYKGKADQQRAMERVAREYEGKARVMFFDTDEDPEAAEGLLVPASPAFLFKGAGGAPYIASERLDIKYGFQMYYEPINQKPFYTYHLGCLNRWELREILEDMLKEERE